MAETMSLDGGFSDLVRDSQSVFRAVMNALSRPGLVQQLHAEAKPPLPLTPELAAVALSLCDHDSPVWLDPVLAASEAVVAWLKFHTGAPIVAQPHEAQFALVANAAEMLALNCFSLGTDEYPDRSTTVVAAADSFEGGSDFVLTGPGIQHHEHLSVKVLPAGFKNEWAENREAFPRGVDLIFVAKRQVIGLPRSTRIAEGH